MSGRETLDLPAPIFRAEAIYTLHSEVAMFPRSFPGLRAASFKVAFPEDFVKKMSFLVELGFASREELVSGVSPRQLLLAMLARSPAPGADPTDCDVLRVTVHGTRSGTPVKAVAESVILPHREWRVAAGALDTGVPLSIAAQMLARRQIATPGVLCPETSVPAEAFFRELAARGIQVSMTPGLESAETTETTAPDPPA